MERSAIQFDSMAVEVDAHNFLIRGEFIPKGDFFVFLNDHNHATYAFSNVQMLPLSAEYQVSGIRQDSININRDFISFISVLKPEDVNKLHFVQASFKVVFYTVWFAILGNLHVHGEAHVDDLLDTEHDFFAVTDASIHPVRSISAKIERKVPFIAINRNRVLGYHMHNK